MDRKINAFVKSKGTMGQRHEPITIIKEILFFIKLKLHNFKTRGPDRGRASFTKELKQLQYLKLGSFYDVRPKKVYEIRGQKYLFWWILKLWVVEKGFWGWRVRTDQSSTNFSPF